MVKHRRLQDAMEAMLVELEARNRRQRQESRDEMGKAETGWAKLESENPTNSWMDELKALEFAALGKQGDCEMISCMSQRDEIDEI